MAARTPKLDPAWMIPLGFTLVDDGRIDGLHWRNEGLKLLIPDTARPDYVATRYHRAVEELVIKRQQLALREVLLPAMGLETHVEYDEYGVASRSYLRIEE